LQVSPAGQSDDRATFLAEFRALRDRAALDFEELAARTHYPSDVLKDAENGPGLPGLPVLAAYVRACGGDVTEWEERWRRLARAAEDEDGLPVRPAGASAAAVAGARAGVTVGPAEAHDTERIRRALRAHRKREEEDRTKVAQAEAGSTWPATGQATLTANGNHHKKSHTSSSARPAAPDTTSTAADADATPVAAAPAQAPAAEADERFGGGVPRQAAARAAGAQEDKPLASLSTAAALRTSAQQAGRHRDFTKNPKLLALVVVAVVVVCIVALALT